MPIVRTYTCDCGHVMKVTLRSDQWQEPPPACSNCAAQTNQQFTPPHIGGSHRARAVKLAEDIAANDYNVADMKLDGQGGPNKVRYKDANPGAPSAWGINPEALQVAAAAGRQTRLQHGSPLDIIKTMPDYIANSKKISTRVW